MEKIFPAFRTAVLLILISVPAPALAGQDSNRIPQADSTGPSSYVVPEEQSTAWEEIQNVARKDYDVCLEHCANDQACMARCKKAYQRRLEVEYYELSN